MACAWLVAALDAERPELPGRLAGEVDQRSWDGVCELVATGVNSPPTTSAGRLFDAVAALCGLGARISYEGQAATELEGASALAEGDRYPIAVIDPGPAGRCSSTRARPCSRCWATSTPTRHSRPWAPGSTPPSRTRPPRPAR